MNRLHDRLNIRGTGMERLIINVVTENYSYTHSGDNFESV